MVEELKKQASELYRERTEKDGILTSESLSLKRLIYIALGIVVAVLITLQIFGGFGSHPSALEAVQKPVEFAKEAPPPDPVDGEDSPQLPDFSPPRATPAQSETLPTATEVAPTRMRSDTVDPLEQTGAAGPVSPVTTPAAEPSSDRKPILRRETDSPARPAKARANATGSETVPAAPEVREPKIDPVELARKELARDVVLEKNTSMSKMVQAPRPGTEYKGWAAVLEKEGLYQVTFTFQDRDSGSTTLYVWRVDLGTREIVPLSYYARRLT